MLYLLECYFNYNLLFTENGTVIPKGCTGALPLHVLGRDPNLFHHPDECIPERFETEEYQQNSSPFQYIPFSAGSRNCIGQKFAMLEVKTIISKLLRYFEASLSKKPGDKDIGLNLGMTLSPEYTIYFNMKKRI